MIILLFFLISLFLPSPSYAATTPYGQTGNWNPVFSDEFQTSSVDLSKWDNGYYYGTTDINMGNADISNSTVDGELLHLGASGSLASFTVGALTTKQTFNSGYFEARMKLAKGNGIWPAFWALYDRSGIYREIDFMEFLGNHPGYYYSTLHINGTTPQGIYTDLIHNPDLSTDYHVYAGEITPTAIIFYLDGVEFWRSSQTDFNYPFGLTVNQGIMCNGVLWDGNQCDGTTFSPIKETLVDWVRVWSRLPDTPTPTITPNQAQGNNNNSSTTNPPSPRYCPPVGDSQTTIPRIFESKRISKNSILLKWGPTSSVDTFNVQYGFEKDKLSYNVDVKGFSTIIGALPDNQPIWAKVAPRNDCQIGTFGEISFTGAPKLPNTGFKPRN